jgi:DNA-binding CsgD family transcriptional regulator
MSWGEIGPELRDVIETSCTPRQVDVLKLQAAGMSKNRIARALDCDRKSIRELVERAHRNIRAELAKREAVE